MRSRLIVIGAIAAGLLLVPVAAIAAPSRTSATATTSSTVPPSTASTSTTSTTAKAAAKTATATTPAASTNTSAARYEVVSGTYSSSAHANKHLGALTARGIDGLTVRKIHVPATRYRIEQRGLTRDAAASKVKTLHTDHFAAFFFGRA